jgi:DNA-binding transcriptional regulator PaaX
MARQFSKNSSKILSHISQNSEIPAKELFEFFKKNTPYKDFYNNIYRLVKFGYLKQKETNSGICLSISEEGTKFLNRLSPEKDGVWKMVIFDIPEKQKYVRVVLRAKLKALHFKKWQNSIWVSPYKLEPEIEEELNSLADKFFIRLIKTSEINYTKDLEKLFP